MRDEELSGQTVAGRYRIIESLGRGGLSDVYKAVDLRLQRVVALKVLPLASDIESKQHFLRQADSLADLNHPYKFCCSFLSPRLIF